MDVRYINSFIEAMLHVLETMASTKATASKPFLKKDKIAKGDVSGIIGLTGDVNGTISISFSEKSILSIVSNMFKEEKKEINEEIRDAVGEIANMVSGQVRQKIETMGRHLNAAIPTVISGNNHTIEHITNYPIIAIPFSTGNGNFTIEVCFEE